MRRHETGQERDGEQLWEGRVSGGHSLQERVKEQSMPQAGYWGRIQTGRRSAKPTDAKSLSLAHYVHLWSTFGVHQ